MKKGFTLFQMLVVFILVSSVVFYLIKDRIGTSNLNKMQQYQTELDIVADNFKAYLKKYKTLPTAKKSKDNNYQWFLSESRGVNMLEGMSPYYTNPTELMYLNYSGINNVEGDLCSWAFNKDLNKLQIDYCDEKGADNATNRRCKNRLSRVGGVAFVLVHPGADGAFTTILQQPKDKGIANVLILTQEKDVQTLRADGKSSKVELSDDDLVYFMTMEEAYKIAGCDSVAKGAEIMLNELPNVSRSSAISTSWNRPADKYGYYISISLNVSENIKKVECCISTKGMIINPPQLTNCYYETSKGCSNNYNNVTNQEIYYNIAVTSGVNPLGSSGRLILNVKSTDSNGNIFYTSKSFNLELIDD